MNEEKLTNGSGKEMVVHEVAFYGDQVDVIERDGELYVAMKPICERLGVDWEAQRQLIQRDPVLSATACMVQTVAKDGKNREMTCLPLSKLNGWLFKLDVSRYDGDQRELLIRYQSECYDALYQHFMVRPGQMAVMARQINAIQNQLDAMTETLNRSYEAWQSVDEHLLGLEKNLVKEFPIGKIHHPQGLVRVFLIDDKVMVLALDFMTIHRIPSSNMRNYFERRGMRYGHDYLVMRAGELGVRYGARAGDVTNEAGFPQAVKFTFIAPSGMALLKEAAPEFYDWYIEKAAAHYPTLMKKWHSILRRGVLS